MLKLTTLLLSSLVLFVGCASPSYMTYNYDYSIEDIQKAIADHIPGGIGKINPTKRVFYSKKFFMDQAKASPLVMRIVIDGERRPYGLDMETRIVSKNTKDVEESFDAGKDFRGQVSLAKRVVIQIEQQLVQRRKNKNIFDDFKAF